MIRLSIDKQVPIIRDIPVLHILASALLIATLFPYLSPFPIQGADIQPVAAIIALVSIFILALQKNHRVSIDTTDVLIFVCAVVYLLYHNIQNVDVDFGVVKRNSALLTGAIIYYAFKQMAMYLSSSVLLWTSIFYFIIVGIQVISPDLYHFISTLFLSRTDTSIDRGLNGPCSEPSFLGYMGLIFIGLTFLFRSKPFNMSSTSQFIVIVISVSLVIVSASASGFFFGAILLVVYVLTGGRKALITALTLSPIIAILGFLLISSNPNIRGLEFARQTSAESATITQDTSAAMRLIGLYVAIPSLLEYPFGTGNGEVDQDYFFYIWNKYSLDKSFTDPLVRQVVIAYALSSGYTDTGRNIIRMGVIFLLIGGLLIGNLLGIKNFPFIATLVLLGVLSSIPLSYPPYWLILAMAGSIKSSNRSTIKTDH